MTRASSHQVTQLLLCWSDGDRAALDELLPLVYDELRRLAHHYMMKERAGHTLQTTALVNEAYLRLIDQRQARWQNRAQFFGVAAQLMRRILVDHARHQQSAKRGGGAPHVLLEETAVVTPVRDAELLALDEALEKLSAFDRRKSQIVELRYFGGLKVDEIAEVLKVSEVTVMRDWSIARAWLYRELSYES